MEKQLLDRFQGFVKHLIREELVQVLDEARADKVYELILKVSGAGPFDGGCVFVAQAIQKRIGGSIKVLVSSDNVAQHAVVQKNNIFYDYGGSASKEEIIKRFEKNEMQQISGIRDLKTGDLPEAKRADVKFVKMLASFLLKEELVQVLDEGKVDQLKQKFPDSSDDIDKLNQADTTPTKKYLVWAVKMLTTTKEPLDNIVQSFQKFDKEQHKLKNKDIFQFKSPEAVFDAFREYENSEDAEKKQGKEKEKEKQLQEKKQQFIKKIIREEIDKAVSSNNEWWWGDFPIEFQKIPKEPGSEPIPKGTVRLYHQTEAKFLPFIAKDGLSIKHAKGIEGPKAIYASTTGFYGSPDKVPTVEFFVPIDKWDSPFVLMDVPLENIIALHLQWHGSVRYLEENDLMEEACKGGYDFLLKNKDGSEDRISDEAKATAYVKYKYCKSDK